MDLILVGLPGAGKSSLGRKLATRLSLPYLDLDRAIIAETGIPDDSADLVVRPVAKPTPKRTIALASRRSTTRLADLKALAEAIVHVRDRHAKASRRG